MNIKLTAVAMTVITYLRNCGARDEESHRSMIIINRPSTQSASNNILIAAYEGPPRAVNFHGTLLSR